MSFLDGLRHRLYVLARREAYGREVAREMRFHLDLEAMARKAEGHLLHDAELAARRGFGNVTYYREEVRRMTPLAWFDSLRQDLTYAWRGLTRSPGFTTGVVLTLALGLGVNAAMFSLLDRLFVRAPAAVAAPREIRRLYVDLDRPREPEGRIAYDQFNYPSYRAVAAAVGSIVPIAAFTQPDSTAIVAADARVPIRRSLVTRRYFDLLSVRPQLGRFFAEDEDRIEAPANVAILSDALWRRLYRADSSVLGRRIRIGFDAYTVVGVAPAEFTGLDLDAVDVWLPANTYPPRSSGGEPWYQTFHSSLRVIIRAPTEAVEREVLPRATRAYLSVRLRNFHYDSTAQVVSGPIVRALGPARRQQELSISVRLAGVAIIVLVIACANVANLLLVRATRRRREIAVRRALGVSGMRLYEQLLTESMLLATIGGGVAVLFALWAGNALRRLLLPGVHWSSGAVDLRTIAFVSVATLVAGVAAGLAPALQATQPDLINSLRAGARDTAYQRSRLRSALVIAQTGLSVVLLVGAGLFVRSLEKVTAVDLGYDAERSVSIRPTFLTAGDHTAERAAAIPQIAERLRGAPGVEAVAYANAAPMQGYSAAPLALPDRDSLPRLGDETGASFVSVSPGYFRATGVALLAGRDFVASDRSGPGGAVIVSSAMARTFWPGQRAIGKCLIRGKRGETPCSIVVGVVADVHRMRVIEQPTMQYYVPLVDASDGLSGASTLLVRTAATQMPAVMRLATQEIKRVLPGSGPPSIRTLAQTLETEFRPWRLGATLFTFFGALALLVAAVGVYSVVSYGVSQRTHEMGVRVALGARLSDILALIVGESLATVAIGVALGVAIALILGRLVASLLYGVSARDPIVLAGAALFLAMLGIVASVVPAWRAARVDPASALRIE